MEYFLNQLRLIRKDSFTQIDLTKEDICKLDNFSKKQIEVSKTEKHHKYDNKNEYKRWVTGKAGELAVDKLLKIQASTWGNEVSHMHNVADLKGIGINVGIKTVEYGKFPVIFKKSYYPEIITIKKNNSIYVLGLATVKCLNTYQDDNLILSKQLRERGVKTGFYAFDKLIPFSTIEDIKKIIKKNI